VRILEAVWTPLVLVIAISAATVLVMLLGSDALQSRVATGLMWLVVVVGLYIFVGNSGVVSFGNVAFMAIGGYTFALLTIPPTQKAFLLPQLPHLIQSLSVPVVPALVLAGLLAGVFAVIVGVPLMRLSGIAASIGLFAVLVVVNVGIAETPAITRGHEAMVGIPDVSSLGFELGWVVVTIFSAHWFQMTRHGLRLRATREDEVAAQAAGISIVSERVKALFISAFFSGIGGALYGSLIGSLTPDVLFLVPTFTAIAMLIIGGMSSLTGAVVGTSVVLIISEVLRLSEQGVAIGALQLPTLPGVQLLGTAILGLMIVILRPSGITGGREVPIPWRVGRPGGSNGSNGDRRSGLGAIVRRRLGLLTAAARRGRRGGEE
jgi:branched-chain amino acid transport system permease protein